jgi:predicted exporter
MNRRRTGLALLVWAAVVAACVWQIVHTRFVADLSAFLPANPDAQQRVLIEQLESGLPARTLLLAIEGGTAAARADASRGLAEALRKSGFFEQVQNGQTEGFENVGSFLFDHRYQLSPAVDARRFTVAGLRDGISDTLSLLGTPAGGALKGILDRDPTGETARIAEALIPSSAPRSEEGVWAGREHPRALLLAISKAPGADLDAQMKSIAAVRASFAALQTGADSKAESKANSGSLTLQVSGAPVFGVESRALIEKEVEWLAQAGTVLMTALLLLAFASLPALAAAFLPVATGVVAGIAAVSLVFGNVHGMTLGFGTTLIGEAVDYAIYYLIQARAGGAPLWLRTGWPTVRLGLLTSVCGFAALVFSGFPGLQQLGVFSLAGLLGAAAFTRFVMPGLMPQGARGQGLRQLMARVAAAAVAWLPKLRLPVLLLAAATVALLVFQPGPLWSAELSSLSPIRKDALDLDASLRADLSAGDARALAVVSGADLEATLRKAEAAALKLDGLVDQGAIGGYDTVARWLPSQQLQAKRLAALPSDDALRAALQEATAGGPLAAARLEPFLADVAAARKRPAVTLESLRAAGLSPLLDALLLQRKDGSWVALLPLQPPPASAGKGDALDAAAVRQALVAVEGAQVLEVGAELKRLYARYLGEAQTQSALGALAVVLIIAVSLRSWRRVLAVCEPLALAVLLTMGILALAQVQLGILHLVGLLLVVAAGSNYALFFDMLRHQGQTAAEVDGDTLASLLLANLTTVLSFGLIAGSSIPALSAIGTVVAIGALLSMLLSATFARPRVPTPAAPASAP